MPGSHDYPNPPAPEWRVPAAPRRPAASPPPPPPPSYNSSSNHGSGYGAPSPGNTVPNASPIPGFTGVSTASWGVNYNRQNHTQAPPPLPPRPSSTTGQPSSAQSPIVNTAEPYKPPIGPPSYGGQTPYDHNQHWTNPPHVSQPPVTSLSHPPPPPPPPPVDAPTYQDPAPTYAAPPQTQQRWHQPPPPYYPTVSPGQYQPPLSAPSHPSSPPAPPTPSLSPQLNTQQFGSITPEKPVSQAPAPTHLPTVGPPLPPKTSPLVIPTGASALGSGGPSDWEHFSPVAGEIDDVHAFKPRRDHSVNAVHELPQSRPTTTPYVIPGSHSPNPLSANPASTNEAVNAETSQSKLRQSPISPGSHPDFQPSPPARIDSTESDNSTVSAVANSESIDGLIEAWNQPITAQNKPLLVHSPRIEPEPPSPQRSPSPLIATTKQPEPTTSEEATIAQAGTVKDADHESAQKTESPRPHSNPVDRYDDLDSWSQSSLERYVAMLRKEAVADSDEERFRIFTTFMAKETKLREILYNIEHHTENVTNSAAEGPQQPPAPWSPAKEPGKGHSPTAESGLIPIETEGDYFTTSGDVEDAEDGSYSPGGRPILPRLHTPHPPSRHRSASNPNNHKFTGGYAAAHAMRSTSVPPQMNEVPRTALSPLTTNPPQRIYTPFRYTEGPQRGSDKLVFDRPAYKAYSALRQAGAESGRVMAEVPTERNRKRSNSLFSVQKDQDETFVGLIREKSIHYRNRPPQNSTPPPLPVPLRQGKPPGPIEDLRAIVSSPANKQSESLWHMTVRRDLEKYSNDFNFVREIFRPWEAASKARKEKLDKERIKRQEESEHHIDSLFNEKEIGYADINILEEEFRQTEARTQLEEERGELEDFISNVFSAVDRRLEEEISTLQVHYESAIGQLSRDNSSKEENTEKHSISHTMKIVNEIHHKLEMRHHKRLEIALDRERRRKKAERRPLVFMGDSAALKKLDNDFDQMEKQNILEAARSRDERANRLMDLFDNAIMHGLGENQALLDDLSAKIARVDESTIRTSGLPDAEVEQILKSIYNLVESLRKDSEAILHAFGVADSALNNADYGVSAAEARYTNADPDVFRQLEAEKKKEDAKIQENLKAKLASVRIAPAKIVNAINEALRGIGKTPFPEQPVPKGEDVIPVGQLYDVSLPNPVRPASAVGNGIAARKMEDDPEHRERLRKALEDAKRRNAAKQGSLAGVQKE